MPCIECQKDNSPYKCPQCLSPYCSVNCYRNHKTKCAPLKKDLAVAVEPIAAAASNSVDTTAADSAAPKNSQFDSLLDNPRIQELLKCEGVKTQLKLVAEILVDPSLSGEYTTEGRRIVALKKIRELRKGGRDANLAIEELATTITHATLR